MRSACLCLVLGMVVGCSPAQIRLPDLPMAVVAQEPACPAPEFYPPARPDPGGFLEIALSGWDPLVAYPNVITIDTDSSAGTDQIFKTKADLLAALRELAADQEAGGLLKLVGYVGDDGDFHALTEADLRRGE